MRQCIMRLFVILILIVGSTPHADAAPGHGGAYGGWHGEEHEHDFHGRGWSGAPGGLYPDLDLDVRSYCPNPPGYYPTVPECVEPWIRMR